MRFWIERGWIVSNPFKVDDFVEKISSGLAGFIRDVNGNQVYYRVAVWQYPNWIKDHPSMTGQWGHWTEFRFAEDQ